MDIYLLLSFVMFHHILYKSGSAVYGFSSHPLGPKEKFRLMREKRKTENRAMIQKLLECSSPGAQCNWSNLEQFLGTLVLGDDESPEKMIEFEELISSVLNDQEAKNLRTLRTQLQEAAEWNDWDRDFPRLWKEYGLEELAVGQENEETIRRAMKVVAQRK